MTLEYTKHLREAIIAVLRQAFPEPMSTWHITLQMPWKTETGWMSSPDWRWWENRDDMRLVAEDGRNITYARRPWSSEVYNSLRSLERKGVITRTPRDPNRRDRTWVYVPDPRADSEIKDLDALLEMS